jgi:hypothetical protein
MRQYYWYSYNCAETERNILTPLCLFIMPSPINKDVANGNGKKLFTEKNRHVQIANNPGSPQCQTEAEFLCPSRPTSFFVTIYL